MTLCKDCRWWMKPLPMGTPPRGEHGACTRIPEPYQTDDWGSVGAFTQGSIDEASTLRTRPDFGCVLGEEKPSDTSTGSRE